MKRTHVGVETLTPGQRMLHSLYFGKVNTFREKRTLLCDIEESTRSVLPETHDVVANRRRTL